MSEHYELPEGLRDGVWSAREGNITSADLVRVVMAIKSGRERYTAFVDAYSNSDRRVDRATQLLRKAGHIKWVGGKAKWEVCK